MKRIKPGIFILVVFIGLLICTQNAFANRAYVTDSFRISLRRGPSLKNKILKFIPSGTAVKILKADDGWSSVELSDPVNNQMRGWVLSRYLVHRKPFETQTRELLETNTDLQEELKILEKNVYRLESERKLLLGELQDKTDSLSKLQTEFTALKEESANYLSLKSEFEKKRDLLSSLEIKNKDLETNHYTIWFAAGAGIVLFGVILGGSKNRRQKGFLN